MIDISVNRMVKSFDLEKKILDGIRPPYFVSSPENWTTMRDR